VQQRYDGKLSFATDGWSSPNHKSYIAITVHFGRAGKPMAMILDIVELPESHTGVNLGTAFVTVLQNFGVDEKVRALKFYQRGLLTFDVHCRSSAYWLIMHQIMIR